MGSVPGVGRCGAAGSCRIFDFEVSAEDTIAAFGAGLAPVLSQSRRAFFRSGTPYQQAAGCVPRALGDNIDHTVDGVRAPHRSTRSTDDFDSLDIFKWNIL